MADKTLLNYISSGLILEQDIHTIDTMIQKMQTNRDNLLNSRQSQTRTAAAYVGRNLETTSTSASAAESITCVLACIFSVVAVISLFTGGFVTAISNAVIPAILFCICANLGNKREQKNAEIRKRTNEELRRREESSRALTEERKRNSEISRKNNELTQKANDIQKTVSHLQNINSQKKKSLEKLYNMNVLYFSYRNLDCVSKIYHVLASGMCDGLTGHTGAYAQIIPMQAVDLLKYNSQQLEKLYHSNTRVYEAIQQSNRLLGRMNTSISQQGSVLDQLKSNSELSVFLQRSANDEISAIQSSTEYLELAERERRRSMGYTY